MRKLLENIYGPIIVDKLLEKNNLLFKKDIIDELNSFRRVKEGGCVLCELLYSEVRSQKAATKFINRNMDFPSWLGDLEKSKKEIILLGESVTPSFQDDGALKSNRKINLAFQLGTLVKARKTFENIIKLTSKSKTKQFWTKLNLLFKGSSDIWLNKLYITDIAKCNADKNPLICVPCGMKFLMRELEFIKPKIILIQGRTAQEIFYIITQLSESYEIKLNKELPNITNKKYKYYNTQKYKSISRGSFTSKTSDFTSDFLCIPHTARTNSVYSVPKNKIFWEDLGIFLQEKYPHLFVHKSDK